MVCVPQSEQQQLITVATTEEVVGGGDVPAGEGCSYEVLDGAGEAACTTTSCAVFDLTATSANQSKVQLLIKSTNTLADLFEQISTQFNHSQDTFELLLQGAGGQSSVLNKEARNKSLEQVGISFNEGVRNTLVLSDVKVQRNRRVGLVKNVVVNSPATSVTNDSITDDDLALGASAASPTAGVSPPPPPALPAPPECSATLDYTYTASLIKPETSYVGLVNQAMTCYLNSLLQALFMTPEFRNALYKWEFDGKEGDTGSKSIPFQLQRLFLNLQTSRKAAVETTELTRSFGWDSSEAWQQHDIQELCRVMFDALEHKFRNTDQADLISRLYEGKMIDYVKCLECKTEKQREDKFLDIPLPVRPFGSQVAYGSVVEALRAFVQPETLDGNNQYHCDKCGKKCDAHKGLKFTKFPYLLTLHLKRFDFDYSTFHRIKLNDKVVFPELLELNSFIASPNNEDTPISEAVPNNMTEENNTVKYDDSSTTDSGSALDDEAQLAEGAAITNGATVAAPSSATSKSAASEFQEDDEGIDLSCGASNLTSAATGPTLENNEKNARRSLEKGPFSYELFAIMIHSGSATGGHYYAYIKDFSSGQWFCFNDQSVSRITNDDIRKTFGGGLSRAYYSGSYSSSTNAYMLMYRQIDKERNCEAIKGDQMPTHIKTLLQNMRDQEEKERSEREKQMEICRIKVYARHPNNKQLIDCKVYCPNDITLKETTQRAHKGLGLEGLIAVEQCRLVAYDKLQDSVEASFDGKEEETIADILSGAGRGKHDLMMEMKELDEVWEPHKPGGVTAKVYSIDLETEEVEGPNLVRSNLSQTVAEFKASICKSLKLSVPPSQLVVVLEKYGGPSRFLDDETKTLKIESFYGSNKVFVGISMDEDPEKPFLSSKLHRIIDRYENIITLHMCLPDTDKENLEELSIPALGTSLQNNSIAIPVTTTEATSPNKTDENSPSIDISDDASGLSSSSCSLPETNVENTVTQTFALPVRTSPPPARPESSLQVLPPASTPADNWSAPEDESAGGAGTDQSASEDSSLTDSDRTLVGDAGDQENPLAQLSSPSDDSPPGSDPQATCSPDEIPGDAHTYKSFKEDLDCDEEDEGGGSGTSHKRPQPSMYFRATPYDEKDQKLKMLKVQIDKRTPLPALKKHLETFVGVPADYFKIFRSYSSSDEFEFSGYNVTYRDGERISIKLGRALRKNEFRGKVFQLSPGAAEPTKFLFDWILAKGMSVRDAKQEILDELKKKYSIEIPFDRCRLRKKSWKNPGQVYYDSQRFEDTMCVVSNWEMFIQELPQPLPVRAPGASLPELVLFVRRWKPSLLTLGDFEEVELFSSAGEELRTKLAEMSDIAPENIEIAKGQGSFPCDLSVLAVQSELEWSQPVNSLNSWPLNIFEDGYTVFYRDSKEIPKILTPEERKEIERTESSRVSRLAGGTSSISNYSPRKERALKIYLDSPPKSRIECDVD